MTTEAAYYPEFEHSSINLSKYIEAAGCFTILLKDGKIVHFFPKKQEDFKEWLTKHNIPNIRDN
jgi:hypothetical protein